MDMECKTVVIDAMLVARYRASQSVFGLFGCERTSLLGWWRLRCGLRGWMGKVGGGEWASREAVLPGKQTWWSALLRGKDAGRGRS